MKDHAMGSGDQSTTLPRAEPGREHGAAAADGGRWGIPSPRVEDEEFEPTIIRGRE